MLSAIRSLRWVALSFVFLISLSQQGFAAEGDSVEARVAKIKERVVALNEGHKKMLENQLEILDMIRQLKIWARHSGGTPHHA